MSSVSRNFSIYFAPAAVGAAYAVSKTLSLRYMDPQWMGVIDYKKIFLAGILLGIALRPLVQRIFWQYHTSIVCLSLLLMGMGAPGKYFELLAWGNALEASAYQNIISEMLAAIGVALSATFVMMPQQRELSFTRLKRLIIANWNPSTLWRILACSLVYLLLFLATRVILQLEDTPVILWERVWWFLSLNSHSPVFPLLMLMTRGLLITLILLPLSTILKGKVLDLGLMFGILLFVLSDFVPLLGNPVEMEINTLSALLFQSVILHFGFAYTVVALLFQEK